MTNSMYSLYIIGHYEMHPPHFCAAGDLVLCKFRDTSHSCVIVITYVVCTANVEVHHTWNAQKVWHWSRNRRMLIGMVDVLKRTSVAHHWVKVLYTAVCEHVILSVVTYYLKFNFDLYSVVMIEEWLQPYVPKWKQYTKGCDIKMY
jgi:hypothetical protein